MRSRAKAALGLMALALAASPIWARPSISKLANECYSRGNQRACGQLAQLAESDNDPVVRTDAVSFLEDQTVLAKVALGDAAADVRSSAVAKLTDQGTLTRVAVHDADPNVRGSAVASLTDQGTLATIAVEDDDENVRYAAAGKIRDMSILGSVANSEKNKHTQMPIIVALREVMAESGVPQSSARILLSVGHESALYEHGQESMAVVSQTFDISIIEPDGTVLLSKTWGPNFPSELPAGMTLTEPDVRVTDLLVDLCLAEHYSPSQIRQALINVAVRSRDDWYDAMHKLKGDDYPSAATALHAVADIGDKDMAALLLANGADVNARDDDGSTPLHGAADDIDAEVAPNGRKEVAELLLAHGADVNARTSRGWTPLHAAAGAHNLDVAAVLLANGADVNAKTNDGQTPLYIAEHVNDPAAAAVVDLLRQHGGHE
jgi:ankyrin repeat protein